MNLFSFRLSDLQRDPISFALFTIFFFLFFFSLSFNYRGVCTVDAHAHTRTTVAVCENFQISFLSFFPALKSIQNIDFVAAKKKKTAHEWNRFCILLTL